MSQLKDGDVFKAVLDDIRARDALGWQQHGVMLDWRYNHDWLREAYEECLDMAVYLKAELMRRAASTSPQSGGCCK